MIVVRAEVLGYCMGVRRAVDAASDALEKNIGRKVYTLGPLIHNQTALDALAEKGLCILNEDDAGRAENGCIVIIRAHGVTPSVTNTLKAHNCTVIDATCPRVKASQKIAAEYAKREYIVILAGDSNHGEVTGIAGYTGPHFILVRNRNDADKLKLQKDTYAVLLSQTTFSPVEFEAIADILKNKYPSIKVMNTICPATRERQAALKRMCPLVDGVLVIGGRNSANTKRLLFTAQNLCGNAELIETAEEIPEKYFLMGRVGITAGASTPDEVINKVEKVLQERKGDGQSM